MKSFPFFFIVLFLFFCAKNVRTIVLKELSVYKDNKHLVNLEAITGTADGYKTIELINDAMVKFFDDHIT